jgi:Zn-dependent protease with chaperone function
MIAVGLSYGFAILMSSFTVILLLVFETTYITMTFLLVSFVSWRGEYRADMDGARATGPEGLISVFEHLKSKIGRDDGSETHPPLSKRIKRLEPLLDEAKPEQ